MSSAKKLATIANGRNLKALSKGQEINFVYEEDKLHSKCKRLFHSGHEYVKSLTNYNFNNVCNFTINSSDMFVKNFALKMTLTAGTYTLPPCFLAQSIEYIRVTYPGESQRREISGETNHLISLYEADRDKTDELIDLCGGNVNVVNPASDVTYYLSLNILTASVNPQIAKWFPVHLCGQNIDVSIKFRKTSDCVVTGTPVMQNAEILYTRCNILDHQQLKSKNEVYQMQWRDVVDYKYRYTGSVTANNPATIRLDAISEIGEFDMLYWATKDSDINTNKNYNAGERLSQVKLMLNDRVISLGDSKFKELLALWKHKKDLKFTCGGEQRYYDVDFSAMSYKDQIMKRTYVPATDVSQSDIKLEFLQPTAVQSTLNVLGVYKSFFVFKNGLVQIVK